MSSWLKAHALGVLVSAAIVLIAVIAVIFVAVNSGTPSRVTITKVTYSQTQAGTNTKPVNVDVTRAARFKALQELLTTYNIQPGVTDTLGESTGCLGGLTSNISLAYSDGETAEFGTYVCGTKNPEFSVAVSDLLASWAR
jgi:hypothetical protein